jgi:hypothetical protein
MIVYSVIGAIHNEGACSILVSELRSFIVRDISQVVQAVDVEPWHEAMIAILFIAALAHDSEQDLRDANEATEYFVRRRTIRSLRHRRYQLFDCVNAVRWHSGKHHQNPRELEFGEAPMSRIYFHLYDGAEVLIDSEGTNLSIGEAAARALVTARALIADDVLQGRINLRQRIDVEDASGTIVHSVPFVQAVEIIS